MAVTTPHYGSHHPDTLGLLHCFSADEWQGSLQSYEPPCEAQLVAAEARLAASDLGLDQSAPPSEVYLHLLLEPPPLLAGLEAGCR